MVAIREPGLSDADGVALAWNDARELYFGMDSRVFLPPVFDDEGLGTSLVEWLIATTTRPNGFARVAEADRVAVGFITATLFEPIESVHREIIRDTARRHFKIDTLVIQRSHWRRSNGRGLVRTVEKWAEDIDASLVKVGTFAHNPQVIEFYDSLGYSQRSVIFEKYL